MTHSFTKTEIPVDLPWDPPGSELRERLIDGYEDCDQNCVYLTPKERDWQDHDASTALQVIGATLPRLRDVLRDAFAAHTNDWALSGGGRMDHCFEGDPGRAEEHAIVALQALWKFGPRVLPEPDERHPE